MKRFFHYEERPENWKMWRIRKASAFLTFVFSQLKAFFFLFKMMAGQKVSRDQEKQELITIFAFKSLLWRSGKHADIRPTLSWRFSEPSQ